MKKEISVFLTLLIVLIFAGCSNVDLDDNKKGVEKNLYSQSNRQNINNSVTRIDNSAWKKPVAQRLLREFNEYYSKMQTDDKIFYYRIMAADRATGLLCVYKDYISDASLEDIKLKQDKINEKIGNSDSTVSFAYTKSGLHIVALMDMQNNSSMEYEPVCDYIRKSNQESKMFEDLFFNHRCNLSDVYIEDLSNKRENFDVNVEQILVDGPDLIQIQEVKNISDEAKGALKKYDRIIEPKNGIYSNRTWRLISAESIYHFLRVNVDGERIDLVTKASDGKAIEN